MTRAFLVILFLGSWGIFITCSAQVYTSQKKPVGTAPVPSAPYQLGAPGDVEARHSGIAGVDDEMKIGGTLDSGNRMPPSEDQSSANRQMTISTAQLGVPAKARDALRKAWDAARKHKLADAARYTERALSFFPKFAEALALRATLEMQDTKSMEQAKADAENAIEYDPNYGAGYVVLGSIYNYFRQFDDATRTLDRGIALTPTRWQGYYEMSIALIAKGDYIGGLRQAERSSTLDSDSHQCPELHLLKAYAYMGLKNRSAATAELEAFRRMDSHSPLLPEAQETLNKVFMASNPPTQTHP
jgi:tetratricopeptide (TPR) repeat protein